MRIKKRVTWPKFFNDYVMVCLEFPLMGKLRNRYVNIKCYYKDSGYTKDDFRRASYSLELKAEREEDSDGIWNIEICGIENDTGDLLGRISRPTKDAVEATPISDILSEEEKQIADRFLQEQRLRLKANVSGKYIVPPKGELQCDPYFAAIAGKEKHMTLSDTTFESVVNWSLEFAVFLKVILNGEKKPNSAAEAALISKKNESIICFVYAIFECAYPAVYDDREKGWVMSRIWYTLENLIRRHNFGKGNIEDNAKLILDQILNDIRRQKNSKR